MQNSAQPSSSTHNEELNRRVKRQQVDLLWRNSVSGYLATALIAWILTLTLTRTIGAPIGTWFIVVLAITVARIGLYLAYRSLPAGEANPDKWGKLFIASSGVIGLCWGALGGVLFPLADEHGQALIAITIAGMVAGAVVSNGFLTLAYYAFFVPALLPLIVRAFQGSGQFGVPVGILAVIFGLFMLMGVRRTNKSLVENLISLYRLEDLTSELNRAQHDQLTGLPTRSLLYDRLEQAILHAERHRKLLAVLFIDLDGFKQLNDSLGHDAGDELLRTVARRLKESVRGEDTVARHGGDEFVIVLGDLSRGADVEPIARKLLAQIGSPYTLGDAYYTLTCSIGISFYPGSGSSGAHLISRADAAMYRAKQRGKNTYELSEPPPVAPDAPTSLPAPEQAAGAQVTQRTRAG